MEVEDNLATRVASFSYYLKTNDQEKIGGLIHDHQDSISATISKETSFPSGRIMSSYSIQEKDSTDHHRTIASFPSLLDHDHPLDNFAFKVKPGSIMQDPKIKKMDSTNGGEIGVFDADKYFNMKLDYGNNNNNIKSQEKLIDHDHLLRMKSNLRSAGTPSVNSEATSSWNSGTALLKRLPRNPAQTKPKMALGRRIISSLGCTGPCMDSSDILVAGSVIEDPKMSGNQPFAFPILSLDTKSLSDYSTTAKKQYSEDKMISKIRKSLDVFGSDTMKKRDVATNLERKLSMLTWDAIPKSSSINDHSTTTIGSSTTICDDMASDASSDLFEIENISGNELNIPVLNNNNNMKSSGDDQELLSGGCMTPTTQYAPSEASIEWSVVTASAADFSSIISDFDENHMIPSDGNYKKNFMRSKRPPLAKESQKTRSSGLLGCKSHKAVNVAETVHKTTSVERY